VTFKCSELSFAILKDLPGIRPAPYLASRGLSWLQRTDDRSVSDEEVEDYLRQSYALVVATLPRRMLNELGLGSAR
jgi:predicted DNA-binding protein (MmcQ/YjbR family)